MTNEERNRAFNAGCDARIAGHPLSANPFAHLSDLYLWQAWRHGWDHVNISWGMMVGGRWPHTQLRPVMGAA